MAVSGALSGHRLVLLDACCLLNLAATRRIEEILGGLPGRFGAAERAAAEALFLRRGGTSEDANEQDPVDLQPLVGAGILEILKLETEEEAASFVRFAAYLDDGEAMTCALAMHRGADVATDDRKAIRVLGTQAPGVPLHTTTGIIKQWAAIQQVTTSVLSQILMDIQDRASFTPGRQDPLQSWWETAVRVP